MSDKRDDASLAPWERSTPSPKGARPAPTPRSRPAPKHPPAQPPSARRPAVSLGESASTDRTLPGPLTGPDLGLSDSLDTTRTGLAGGARRRGLPADLQITRTAPLSGARQPVPDDLRTSRLGTGEGRLDQSQGATFTRGATWHGGASTTLQEDRDRRMATARAAKSFLVRLDALCRQLMFHEPANTSVRRALKDVRTDIIDLRALSSGGNVAMVFADGHAFVNGVWVRTEKRIWEAAVLLTRRLAAHQGRGLVLEQDATPGTIIELGQVLRMADRLLDEDRVEDLSPLLQLSDIQLLPLPSPAAREAETNPRLRAAKLFREGLLTVTRGELAKLDLYMRRRQRALVQGFVELAELDLEHLGALTTIRDPTLPAAAHTLMVCIYSVAMGKAMGLDRRRLLRLGVAALHHNLGEALLPEELFTRPRELTGEERGWAERHPLMGARHILEHHGLSNEALQRTLVAAEHHLNYDGHGGYPLRARPSHLYARIIAVADRFDALLSDRPYRGPFDPDTAIRLLWRERDRGLDPVLVRTLIRLIGRYPTGTALEMDTGEVGIVTGPGRGATPLHRPRVLLISDEEAYELDKPVLVDLGELHPLRDDWRRSVARVLDPARLGVKSAAFLFGDWDERPPERLDLGVEVARI